MVGKETIVVMINNLNLKNNYTLCIENIHYLIQIIRVIKTRFNLSLLLKEKYMKHFNSLKYFKTC